MIREAIDALVSGLNPAQLEAVEHLEGPLLIVAGGYLTPSPSPYNGEGERAWKRNVDVRELGSGQG